MWCLALATNAIVCWSTEYHGLGVAALRGAGRDVDDELLAHIWPTHHENVHFYGTHSVTSIANSPSSTPTATGPCACPRRPMPVRTGRSPYPEGQYIEDGVGVDDGQIWGEASVPFPDWNGTAQLDERLTVPWEGLARTVGLDRDQWQVIGFSIGGGENGYHLQVVATPRDVWEKTKPDDHAEIEATEFLVHNVDPLAILQQMTHVFELKMRHRGLDGRQVRIRALSDLPSELFVEEIFGPQE